MLGVLDPHFVCLHDGIQSDSVAGHIDRLTGLFKAVRSGELDLATSDSLYSFLSTANMYPLREAYSDLLAQHSIYHTSGNDLARLVTALLERCTILEDVSPQYEVASCTCSMGMPLSAACQCHDADISSVTEETIHGYAAVAESEVLIKPAFFASDRGSAARTSLEIRFASILNEADELAFDKVAIVELPIAPSETALIENVDCEWILQSSGTDTRAVELAVRGAVHQFAAQGTMKWSFAPNFLSDAVRIGVTRSPSLGRKFLRSCAEVACGAAAADGHWLRISASGGSDQVRRSGAAAWRQDVDRDVHIHYWVMPDGSRQLAAIVHHNDFDIPDPNLSVPVIQTDSSDSSIAEDW